MTPERKVTRISRGECNGKYETELFGAERVLSTLPKDRQKLFGTESDFHRCDMEENNRKILPENSSKDQMHTCVDGEMKWN